VKFPRLGAAAVWHFFSRRTCLANVRSGCTH
jgi:hypothetical protein